MTRTLDGIIEVTGGLAGDSYLVVGNLKTALIDCGMAYCALDLIHNIKQALNTRPLDYVLISHSHYDHIGAIPYLKEEWPDLKIFGAAYDQHVLNKPSALERIKRLSLEAAELYAGTAIQDYNDNLMKINALIADEDILDLGDLSIQVLETPGHTKTSLSFYINDEVLLPSETIGLINESGKNYSTFLVSYTQTIKSIQKCQALEPKFLILPHHGQHAHLQENECSNYFRKCLESAENTRNFILHFAELGYDEDEIVSECEKSLPRAGSLAQPIHAFRINTRSMIKVVLSGK